MTAQTQDAQTPRVVLVTGGNRGIGRSIAEAFRAQGDQVVVTYRSGEAPEGVDAVRCDVSDTASVDAAFTEIEKTWGPVDVVVANAGHSIARPVLDCVDRFDTYERTVALNYLGAVGFAQPFLGAMAARGSGQLVGVTTTNARMPVPGWAPYCASKAAFDSWLRCAEPELRQRGVAVSIVAFPLVRTPMIEPTYGAHPPLAMSAEAAARCVERAVETRRAWIGPWWARPAEVLTAAAPVLSARALGARSLPALRRR